MKIELLHIADCPNWEDTQQRLELALANTAFTTTAIDVVLIDSDEKARDMAFAGSPTILLDGVDAFPSDGSTNDLACRIYVTPTGLAGSPTQQQLEEAIAAHG